MTTAITIQRTMFLAKSFKGTYLGRDEHCGGIWTYRGGWRAVSTRHYYNPVRHCHNRIPALAKRVQGRTS
jgi:hypothetical protein